MPWAVNHDAEPRVVGDHGGEVRDRAGLRLRGRLLGRLPTALRHRLRGLLRRRRPVHQQHLGRSLEALEPPEIGSKPGNKQRTWSERAANQQETRDIEAKSLENGARLLMAQLLLPTGLPQLHEMELQPQRAC